jgi:translocation and assembly module TamB
MRFLLRIFLIVLAVIVILPVLTAAGVFIGLNSEGGRNFAAQKINELAGPALQIGGLGGHFPEDIKIRQISLADANGVWLTGAQLELRWHPRDLLSHDVSVTALTAARIAVARAPVAGQAQSQSQGSGTKLPDFRLNIDRVTIDALDIAPALAGEDTVLAITGRLHLENLTKGNAILTASAVNGRGVYQLEAGLDPRTINTTLHVSEPPDGLLGHFAGPQVHAPLNLNLTLNGPRNAAALSFNAALGAAQLDGIGTISLDPAAPGADVVLTVPALAPFAAIANQKIAGNTKLHLVASQTGNDTSVALDGDVALTQAPGPTAELVGQHGHLSLKLELAKNTADIQTLHVSGTGFDMTANGTVTRSGVNLNTHLALNDVAAVSPGISGSVTEDGTIIGAAQDFAVNTVLTGDVAEQGVPSGPFSIAINAQHLPKTPEGTLTGSGALEGYPLLLDAQFSRGADGGATVVINNALWRSLDAKANLALAEGAMLPTGTAVFKIGSLADFRALSPVKLAGAVDGNFSHLNGQDFALNLNARNLVFAPSLGAINAKVSANGPVNALAVNFTATLANFFAAPARIAAAGVVNLGTRSAALSALSASWRSLDAKLLGPAAFETKPGVIVHQLAIRLNGGRIKLDGVLAPRLNAVLGISDLPASLAELAAPGIAATGTLDATAALTGTPQAPAGKITVDARNIRVHSGPAAALPAANFTAAIQLAGKTANINAKLALGADAMLAADGLVPLSATGPLSLHLTGQTDLRLLDPILTASGSTVRGVVTPDITITGTAASPLANGTARLAGGSAQNIGSGLNLTKIAADISAAGRVVMLQNFTASAGAGKITGHGSVDLGAAGMPLDLVIDAANATPVASDLLTENLDAALTIKGALQGAMALAGDVNILSATINIPKSLPPSVANLPILNEGEKPPPPPPPAPPIALDLSVRAKNQIFIRGDGLFAELGGKLRIGGTAAHPDPEGGFTLVRGNFALAGKTLQLTSGTISFNGDGFIPSLDLEATTTTTTNATASLIIGGTADKPTITLSASPPLPSDEVLSQLLFGQATTSLSPFQAASLAAALASLSGVGGSAVSDPLGGVRNALGLDELSVGGGSGAPTVNAGRYVAPGVYVGAQQSTSGQGTQATVQINLYKGLKLQTATGTSGGGSGASSSVGLTYQFNY